MLAFHVVIAGAVKVSERMLLRRAHGCKAHANCYTNTYVTYEVFGGAAASTEASSALQVFANHPSPP